MKKILLIFAIVLISAGCNMHTSQKMQDDLSKWQNYSNTEYGFEFRYPAEWSITYVVKRDQKENFTPLAIQFNTHSSMQFSIEENYPTFAETQVNTQYDSQKNISGRIFYISNVGITHVLIYTTSGPTGRVLFAMAQFPSNPDKDSINKIEEILSTLKYIPGT